MGTIKSSNLCTEIVEYTAPDEVAVCNLASISLPKYVENGIFDHDKLFQVVQVVTKNLNKIIDLTFYPIPEAERSNKRHRPIGIGIQGLQETFFKLRYPFESPEAAQLNKEIFETIYFAALTTSMELAKQHGVYETYPGSPVSRGILQYDMWNVVPSKRWDWKQLKRDIKQYGIRNSLLLSPMPTASTSQILGNTEWYYRFIYHSFEPITSNIYVRRVLSGEFPVINSYLVQDLIKLNIWNGDIMNRIIADKGSVQNIEEIPLEIRNIYKTVWEIKQKVLIDMATDRGAFIDQSQSLSCFVANPTYSKLTSMHFYGWKKGLKTGLYYLRTKPVADAIQFTIDPKFKLKLLPTTVIKKPRPVPKNTKCTDEICLMCSS